MKSQVEGPQKVWRSNLTPYLNLCATWPFLGVDVDFLSIAVFDNCSGPNSKAERLDSVVIYCYCVCSFWVPSNNSLDGGTWIAIDDLVVRVQRNSFVQDIGMNGEVT